LFHADGRTEGQTDMTKPIDAFHNFAKPLKKGAVNKTNIRFLQHSNYKLRILRPLAI
jgi:hypothetical protein